MYFRMVSGEPATDPKIPEDSDMKGKHGPRTQESIDKGNAQLDGLAKILEKYLSKVWQMLLYINIKKFGNENLII